MSICFFAAVIMPDTAESTTAAASSAAASVAAWGTVNGKLPPQRRRVTGWTWTGGGARIG